MSMDNQDARQFRGVWIPADIWLSKELSLQEKVMLVEIESLQHPERGCFKTNKRLAEFFNLSASRVSEVISSLARKGFIRIVNIRDGKQIVERRIFLSTPFDKPDTPSEKAANPLRDSEAPPSEKAEERGSSLSNTQERVSGEVIAAGADAQVAAGNVVPFAKRGAAKPGTDAQFEAVWAIYPKRDGSNPKTKALSAWKARLRDGVSPEDMAQGVIRYAAYCAAKGSTGTEFVMQAQRFFGPGREFENPWSAPTTASAAASRHHGFDQRDYTAGTTQREDGTHAF